MLAYLIQNSFSASKYNLLWLADKVPKKYENRPQRDGKPLPWNENLPLTEQ